MNIDERAKAVRRAKRALKTLGEHPGTSLEQLGTARERLNDCYRFTDPDDVWVAVDAIENIAAAVLGVPDRDEPATQALSKWVSRGGALALQSQDAPPGTQRRLQPPSDSREVGGEEVNSVAVEVAPSAVAVLGGAGVGVAGEDLREVARQRPGHLSAAMQEPPTGDLAARAEDEPHLAWRARSPLIVAAFTFIECPLAQRASRGWCPPVMGTAYDIAAQRPRKSRSGGARTETPNSGCLETPAVPSTASTVTSPSTSKGIKFTADWNAVTLYGTLRVGIRSMSFGGSFPPSA